MRKKKTLKFWKTVKSLTGLTTTPELPPCIVKGKNIDMVEVLGWFNEHFIDSGSLFDSTSVTQEYSQSSCLNGHVKISQPLSFKPLTVSEVHKALKL